MDEAAPSYVQWAQAWPVYSKGPGQAKGQTEVSLEAGRSDGVELCHMKYVTPRGKKKGAKEAEARKTKVK